MAEDRWVGEQNKNRNEGDLQCIAKQQRAVAVTQGVINRSPYTEPEATWLAEGERLLQ